MTIFNSKVLRNGKLTILFISGVFLFWTGGVQADMSLKLCLLDKATPRQRASASEAKCAQREAIHLGEPVSVRLEFTNTGSTTVQLIPTLDPAFGCISLHLVTSGGTTQRVRTARWETRDVYAKSRAFPPQAHLVYETFLFGQMQNNFQHDYLFPKPGAYQLFVRYENCGEGVITESNPIKIVVGNPINKWEDLKRAGIVDYIEGQSHTDEQHATRAAQIRKLLDQTSTNPYEAWISKEKSSSAQQTR